MSTATKQKPAAVVKTRIEWKNPDAPRKLSKWGEFGEYFKAEIEVNPTTGKGTIKFIKNR